MAIERTVTAGNSRIATALRTGEPQTVSFPTRPKLLTPKEFWETREKQVRFCMDGIVAGESGVLLGLRTSWPLNNKLCFFGGSLLLGNGNAITDVVINKVQAESGLVVAVRGDPIGTYSLIFKRKHANENGAAGSVVHDIVQPFVLDVIGGAVKLDAQNSTYQWVSELNDGLHTYVYRALSDSGLFPNGKYRRDGIRPKSYVIADPIISEE